MARVSYYAVSANRETKRIGSLGDVINEWREEIDLEPVPFSEGSTLTARLKVPFTYCWSPALVPKAFDWPDHIG